MLYSLLVSDLELPRPVSQEVPVDPFWDFANDVSADGLWGFLHRAHNLINARQTMHICEVVDFLLFTPLRLGFFECYGIEIATFSANHSHIFYI